MAYPPDPVDVRVSAPEPCGTTSAASPSRPAEMYAVAHGVVHLLDRGNEPPRGVNHRGRDTEEVTSMPDKPTTGSWVVCIRDLPSNTGEYLGYFRSEDRAESLADRLRRDVAAVGAEHIIDVTVHWVRPEPEYMDARDELLADLAEMGYAVQR